MTTVETLMTTAKRLGETEGGDALLKLRIDRSDYEKQWQVSVARDRANWQYLCEAAALPEMVSHANWQNLLAHARIACNNAAADAELAAAKKVRTK